MASMYDDFITAGLLSPKTEREAALMGLFALGNQIGNRSAPRLSPTPPPMDLNAVMSVYQNQMNMPLKRGWLMMKMREAQAVSDMFKQQPVNEVTAQRIAQREYWPTEQAATALYGMSPLSGEDHDLSLKAGGIPAMAQDAVTAALPAARTATTIPDALSFMEPSKAMALMQIGQKAPKVGLQGLMSALGKKSDVLSPAAFQQQLDLRSASRNLRKASADNKTSLQRDYELAKTQGFTGSLLQFIKEKKKPADMLKTVPGVGVVDFSDPDNPVIKMASVASQRGRYKDLGPYYLNGQYIGEGSFDKFENKRTYIDSEGQRVDLPALAQPRSEGFMGGAFLNSGNFYKLTKDLTDAEIGFDQLKKYFKNIKNTRQGFGRLADIFTSHMKTLAGERKLSLEELSTRVARGQLEGLLGKMRIEVVGGGVMTEQDAIRVIEALGGKVGALQNKEVVAAAIKRIMGEKLMNYKNMLMTYNINVKNRYGATGYPEKTMLNLPADLFTVAPQTSGGWSIQR